MSTASGAPPTSFFASVSHTLLAAQVPAFSVLADGGVFSDTIAGADDVLSAAGRVVRIMNRGTGPITLNSATLPLNPGGFFSVAGLVPASVLPPNGFLDLEAVYAPSGAPAVHAGTLAVDAVAGPPALAVGLTAEAGPAPPSSSSSGGGGCGLAGLDALAAAVLISAALRRLRAFPRRRRS